LPQVFHVPVEGSVIWRLVPLTISVSFFGPANGFGPAA
jgi:hypothetical protein